MVDSWNCINFIFFYKKIFEIMFDKFAIAKTNYYVSRRNR